MIDYIRQEQELREIAKRERDRQIGRIYKYCECDYEVSRSQYGSDDFCPKCGKRVDWKGVI